MGWQVFVFSLNSNSREKVRLSCILVMVMGLVSGCAHFKASEENSPVDQSVKTEIEKGSKQLQNMKTSEIRNNQIDPAHMQAQADYYFTLAESHSLRNEPVKAVENYKLALIYDKNSSHIHYRMSLEFVKLGLITQSVLECKQALEIDPRHRDSSLLLGGLLSAMLIFDEALAVYEKALVHYPDDPEISLFIGILYGEKGEFKKSIDYLQKLIRNEKIREKSKIWYYLGQMYASRKEPDLRNAESAYITSLALKPDVQVVLALGELYQSQNAKTKLEQLYSRYQEEQGGNPLIAEKLSQIYINNGNLKKALDQLKVMESHDSNHLNVSFKIALIMIEQKKYDLAIKKLKALLKKSPGSEKIHFYLGSLYEEVKNYREAIKNFDNVPPTSHYYEDSVIHISYLYKILGNLNEAIEKIKQGLAKKREFSRFWLLYASLLREDNQLTQAEKVLNSAVKLFPENKEIHFQLGSVYDLTGNTDKSVEHMEKVLEIDGNHVQALNYLAYIYANVTLNLETAERLVRKALKLQPGDGFIMDTLGWVLFKKNRLEEAIQVLEKAHNKESGESIIAEHLGDAYFRYQLPMKARIMYKKAVKLEKDPMNKAKILSKLNSVGNQREQIKNKEFSRLPAMSE